MHNTRVHEAKQKTKKSCEERGKMERGLRECSMTSKAKEVSLEELNRRLQEFNRVRGWEQYHSPRNLLLALVSF